MATRWDFLYFRFSDLMGKRPKDIARMDISPMLSSICWHYLAGIREPSRKFSQWMNLSILFQSTESENRAQGSTLKRPGGSITSIFSLKAILKLHWNSEKYYGHRDIRKI